MGISKDHATYFVGIGVDWMELNEEEKEAPNPFCNTFCMRALVGGTGIAAVGPSFAALLLPLLLLVVVVVVVVVFLGLWLWPSAFSLASFLNFFSCESQTR